MPLAARILFGAFGLVVAAYAAASLTGRLTPPWWEREGDIPPQRPGMGHIAPRGPLHVSDAPVPGREAISIGVGAVGLTLAGFAVLGRRHSEPR